LPADYKSLSEDLFFVRGVSIILVVLVHVLGVEGHQGLRSLFHPELPALKYTAELIHTFNLAVMLIGSGVAWRSFARPDPSVGSFFRKRLQKLVLPLLIWLPVMMLVECFSKGRTPTVAGVLGGLIDPDQASIFWFIHALLWCTFLGWFLRRVTPRVEWLFPVAIVGQLMSSRLFPGSYADFVLYWFCYFSFGIAIGPLLSAAREWLAAKGRLGLLAPVGLFLLLVGLYHLAPADNYQRIRPLSGPAGFLMQLALAVTLGDILKRTAHAVRAYIVRCGSASMALYLFHIYFVSGSRMALSRVLHTQSVPFHLLVGWTAGFVGPWLLWTRLKSNRLFLLSVGMSRERADGESALLPVSHGCVPSN
jgi:fucose 4-O-acetylase-like acetyltransferase